MIDFAKLQPYRRAIRPVSPESFPRYLEDELDRVAVSDTQLIQALQELNARLTALE